MAFRFSIRVVFFMEEFLLCFRVRFFGRLAKDSVVFYGFNYGHDRVLDPDPFGGRF